MSDVLLVVAVFDHFSDRKCTVFSFDNQLIICNFLLFAVFSFSKQPFVAVLFCIIIRGISLGSELLIG